MIEWEKIQEWKYRFQFDNGEVMLLAIVTKQWVEAWQIKVSQFNHNLETPPKDCREFNIPSPEQAMQRAEQELARRLL